MGDVGKALRQVIVALNHGMPWRLSLKKPVEPCAAIRKAAQILEIIDRNDPQPCSMVDGLCVA